MEHSPFPSETYATLFAIHIANKIAHATGKKDTPLLPDRDTRSVVGRETYYLSLIVAYAILFAIP